MEKAIWEYFATDFNYTDSVKIAFSSTMINFLFTASLWASKSEEDFSNILIQIVERRDLKSLLVIYVEY